MKVHWHLGYSNKTGCGILAYKRSDSGCEADTVSGGRIEYTGRENDVTCKSCRRVMLIGRPLTSIWRGTP